jgi:cobaltochelatase CobN
MRNESTVIWLFWVLVLATAYQSQGQDQTRVALVVGDSHSAAALAAVHQVSRLPEKERANVRVFIKSLISPEDRKFVEQSDVVIAYPRFASLVRELVPHIQKAAVRGALVVGVGPTIEPEFEQQGIKRDEKISTYFEAGGIANLVNMLRVTVARRQGINIEVPPPDSFPASGYYDPRSGKAYSDFESYINNNSPTPSRTVGIYFSRDTALGGDTELLSAIEAAIERRGLKTLMAFGYPGDEVLPKLFMDSDGQSRIATLIGLTLKIGNVPEKIVPVLERLDVPVINAIALNNQSLSQWRESPIGLDLLERSWQVGLAEFAGTLAPTIVATRETVVDAQTGQTFALNMPIPERVERLADRAAAWIRLREQEPKQRRVAVVYYNYPPGRESIGASYLNVAPDSLKSILDQLHTAGFDLGDCPREAESLFAAVHAYGSNPPPGETAVDELDRMVRSRRVQLVPLDLYHKWFDRLPKNLRDSIVEQWGTPAQAAVMTWQDSLGEKYFVLPILQYGNLVLGPQPTRGWQHDIAAAYHDITLPPHHQYLAFYWWLQHVFEADAMLHVGTHATHEWLPGREVGFDLDDTGEAIVGSVPQLYIYIVDDVGEGLQAKRRGLAAMISHQTPPLDRASLSPDLRELSALISDLSVAEQKGALAAAGLREDITRRSRDKGLLNDLSIVLPDDAVLSEEQIEEVEHHLKRIGERLTPFGMHTFGEGMNEAARQATVDAILSVESELIDADRELRANELAGLIDQSSTAEIRALLDGLSGRYIPAGPGGDPIRNAAVLPTGKNFYGFDPARMPSPATYAIGEKLAQQFLSNYAIKHPGKTPERLVFNLWGSESSRHEGAIESQILALMGVRPVWDSRGRVQAIELIPRAELGRPRVDCTIVPSGLYRDLFAKLMLLLDQAVEAVKLDTSDDNPMNRNIRLLTDQLVAQGVNPDLAVRMASVRLFSLPSGSYGAGLEHVIQAENSWKDPQEVNAVYMNRMSHLFGQGFWGTRATDSNSGQDLSPQLLESALRGAEGVIHSRSSNVYGAIDSDDFYQYLGGTAQAVRLANDGESVDVFVADLSHPREGETMSLESYMGRELRARYLNPKWIDAMLNEGYAGSRMIRQVVDNLWGWQVTVPEAVDDAKWQELYETYVEDRHQLNVQDRFASAQNLAAYEALVHRMRSVVSKGYWRPDEDTVQRMDELIEELRQSVQAEQTQIANAASQQTAPAAIAVASLPETTELADTTVDRTPSSAANLASTKTLTNSASTAAGGGKTESRGMPPLVTKDAPVESATAAARPLMELVQGFAIETTASTTSENDAQSTTEHRLSKWPISLLFLGIIFVLLGIGWLSNASAANDRHLKYPHTR